MVLSMLRLLVLFSFVQLCASYGLRWKLSPLRNARLPLMSGVRGTVMHQRSPVDIEAGEWSHFLSTTYPTIEEVIEIIHALRVGVDALELRVDLLSDQSPQSLQRGIAALKDASQLPIIFTVRTQGQLGRYPDTDHEGILELMMVGLTAGVEWIDIEANLPLHIQSHICNVIKTQYAGATRIIGSLHTTTVPTEHHLKEMYQMCDLHGAADILKVVTGAVTDTDCEAVHRIGQLQPKPYIGICLGEAGAYARVLNRRFTPVTHALMAAAAPGQLTAKQLLTERLRRGFIAPKQYYLFGSPIQHSLSPAMHNAAFKALLMPHVYALNEQSDVQQYRDVINIRNFSGASVTIPHKESILPLLHEIHGAAQAIGAVNTIVAEATTDTVAGSNSGTVGGNTLIGYNTDWLGMRRPLGALLQRKAKDQSAGVMKPLARPVGLVIGAGGTARAACYAVKDLGLGLIVANRSPNKALELANRFGGRAVRMEDLSTCAIDKHLQVVISTLPAAANFTLPDALLRHKPVVLDVVYKPANTSLISQALENRCMCVQGASMLLDQAVEQFELWHKRKAPQDVMYKAVFTGVDKLDSLRPLQARPCGTA